MFYIFITFLTLARFASADELCSKALYEVCFNDYENAPRSFPKTAEDLKKFCDFHLKDLECEIEYTERCQVMLPPSDILPPFYELYSVVHEVCSKDTLLHAAVVDNLECYHDFFTTEEPPPGCFDIPALETLQMQAKELLKEGFEDVHHDDEDVDAYACLNTLNFLACISTALEQECGTVAMDAFVDIVQKTTGYFDLRCDSKAIKMLPSVIRLRSLENEIEEALKRRRK